MFGRKLLSAAILLVSVVLVYGDALPNATASVLKPIHIRDWEAAHGIGLERRASKDFADLDPRTQSQLVYGRPGGELRYLPLSEGEF